MSWRDIMLLKIMGNRTALKILSIPIMINIMTAEMKAFMWVGSLHDTKRKEKQLDVSQKFNSTVGIDESVIQRYIEEQVEKDTGQTKFEIS